MKTRMGGVWVSAAVLGGTLALVGCDDEKARAGERPMSPEEAAEQRAEELEKQGEQQSEQMKKEAEQQAEQLERKAEQVEQGAEKQGERIEETAEQKAERLRKEAEEGKGATEPTSPQRPEQEEKGAVERLTE